MAITRAIRGLGLPSLPFSPARWLSSTGPVAAKQLARVAPAKANKRPQMHRPEAVRRFIGENGNLRTTENVQAFLRSKDIEHDNSKVVRVILGENHNRLTARFKVKVVYSRSHILHPHHLIYLDPRDHPMIESIKAKYTRKKQEEPLWLIMQSANGYRGLIKSLGQRRMTAAFWRAMSDLGYDRWRSPTNTDIKGTVHVTMFDTLQASNQPADIFGKAAAEAVVDMCHKQASQAASLRTGEKGRGGPKRHGDDYRDDAYQRRLNDLIKRPPVKATW